MNLRPMLHHILPSSIPHTYQNSVGISLLDQVSMTCCTFLSFIKSYQRSFLSITVRKLMLVEDTPNLLSLLAGKPNASTFPIMSFSVDVRSPDPSAPIIETLKIEGSTLNTALQYGQSRGDAELIKIFFELQEELHGRKKDDSWRISIGAGGMDILYKAVLNLTDPGDSILVEVRRSNVLCYF